MRLKRNAENVERSSTEVDFVNTANAANAMALATTATVASAKFVRSARGSFTVFTVKGAAAVSNVVSAKNAHAAIGGIWPRNTHSVVCADAAQRKAGAVVPAGRTQPQMGQSKGVDFIASESSLSSKEPRF